MWVGCVKEQPYGLIGMMAGIVGPSMLTDSSRLVLEEYEGCQSVGGSLPWLGRKTCNLREKHSDGSWRQQRGPSHLLSERRQEAGSCGGSVFLEAASLKHP